ncbi:MAG: PEP-CTERM sorting domain-containing protein [Pseudomonadota bacterium]
MNYKILIACLAAFAVPTTVHAAAVNGTGNVTPEVIFGSGNANGSFTGQTQNNIEVGLRGKQRFPPANIFNYDGNDTYVFDSTVLNTNPANRSVFNFEWAINVNADGTGTSTLADFDYALSIDQDPTNAVSFLTFDPINVAFADHSFGNGGTANGAGVEAVDATEYANNLTSFSVVQQSWNLGFGFSPDPDLPGRYSFDLQVLQKGTSNVLSSASIVVDVKPVPVPAALPLLLTAFGGLFFLVRRRRRSAI